MTRRAPAEGRRLFDEHKIGRRARRKDAVVWDHFCSR